MKLLFSISALSFSLVGWAQEHTEAENSPFDRQVNVETLPVPQEENQLFYLQRDPDENTIVYCLNIKNGELNEDEPVRASWIRYTEGGTRKELSFFQRKLAYGIHSKPLKNDQFELRLTAYKKILLTLSRCPKTEKFRAFTNINNKKAAVDRIFVRITGGSMLNPHIKYIEIAGTDYQTGQKVSMRVLPL